MMLSRMYRSPQPDERQREPHKGFVVDIISPLHPYSMVILPLAIAPACFDHWLLVRNSNLNNARAEVRVKPASPGTGFDIK